MSTYFVSFAFISFVYSIGASSAALILRVIVTLATPNQTGVSVAISAFWFTGARFDPHRPDRSSAFPVTRGLRTTTAFLTVTQVVKDSGPSACECYSLYILLAV